MLYSLSIICEMNLLNLINPWRDNNYQIQTKVLQYFTPKMLLNKAHVKTGERNSSHTAFCY